MLLNMKGWFLGLEAVSNQSSDEIDQEIERAAVAGMLNLRNIFELVIDSFNNGAFAQEELVFERDETILHIFAELGNELKASSIEKMLKERLRYITPVAKELTEQVSGKCSHRFGVMDMRIGQTPGQDLAEVIDHQMRFEAVKPTHRGLAPRRQVLEHAVAVDTVVIAHGQRSRVDETNPGAFPVLLLQIGTQWHQYRRQQFDETVVAHQRWKLPT